MGWKALKEGLVSVLKKCTVCELKKPDWIGLKYVYGLIIRSRKRRMKLYYDGGHFVWMYFL